MNWEQWCRLSVAAICKSPSRRFLLRVLEETQIANGGISQLPAMGSHELSRRDGGDRVSKQLLHR